jgi:hypothetical protein
MADFLVMDAVTAANLRGATAGDEFRLNPRETADGRFALPVAVLADPAFGWLAEALGALATAALGAEDWALEG